MSKYEKKANVFLYTDEEIEAAGKPAPDEPVDFTYPDGFFRYVNSLDFLPDTRTRLQMAYGLMANINGF